MNLDPRIHNGKLDVSFYGEIDPRKIQRIKVAMLDAYDRLVELDAANDTRKRKRGKPLDPPSVARLRTAMPFWVHEKLAHEIHRQLAADGELKMRRGNPRAAENGSKSASFFNVSLEEIAAEKARILEENQAATRDRHSPRKHAPFLTPKEVADWARRRYNEAWRTIQGIHLKASIARLAASVERLDMTSSGLFSDIAEE